MHSQQVRELNPAIGIRLRTRKGKDEEAQSLNNCLKAIKAKLYQKEAELLDRGFIITAEFCVMLTLIKWNPL